MQTLHNPTARLFHLPRLTEEKTGESFGGPGVMLQSTSSRGVPDWYARALKTHRTWKKRLDGLTVRHPGGAAGQFERRVLDYRRGRKANAGVSLDDLQAQMDALKSKIERRTDAAKEEAKADKGDGGKTPPKK